MLAGLKRRGFLSKDTLDVTTMADPADDRLFAAVQFSTMSMSSVGYSPIRFPTRYKLRPKIHGFQLPTKDDQTSYPES